ncbi:hypothetical protein C8J56DRAFT_832139 [Mycena floridula]|nr:hypothetical protein C8J56DRAFT_832139 [Mycena floridula]
MAQPVFDEHPLDQYLRESGETAEFMPGIAPELVVELGVEHDQEEDDEDPHTESELWRNIVAILSPYLNRHGNSPFAERFKYDVISSSLLATSLSSVPHPLRSPAIPPYVEQQQPHRPHLLAESHYWISSFAFALALVLFRARYYLTGFLLLCGPLFSVYLLAVDTILVKHDMSSTLDGLQELMSASDVWDSVVQEAITVIEKDEQHSTYYGSLNPLSPSSSLRVTLQSSLHTTQTHCDNVRQLFMALTSPPELSQISEMYAPPSPRAISPSPLQTMSVPPTPTPARQRRLSSPADFDPKRSTWSGSVSTWNGSYSTLAQAGSPMLKRREKRRSDLSALLQVSGTQSVPITPPAGSPNLADLKEDEEGFSDTFGSAALNMRSRHQSQGLENLGIHPRSPQLSTFSSGSRFTTLQTHRHPLSLSALHVSLNGALASKRYACSHLLALRFEDETDDGYWEDVRSVISLLTSTLADASARLTVALEVAETARIKDQVPSVPHSRTTSAEFSFAPVPSQLSRFAAHVDSISTALTEAKESLADCVKSIKEEEKLSALSAYERLRRELGFALRECERGRDRLLEITAPPRALDEHLDDSDLPGLTSDDSDKPSDDSDKQEASSPVDDEPQPLVSVVGENGVGLDDATAHLLLERQLPPPGIEQVFESESGHASGFSREKSKLTRAERIELAKKAREQGSMSSMSSLTRENTGPGIDVVQELKDVIWKVGERRRKLADSGG